MGGFDVDVVIVGAGPAGATTALALLDARPAARGRVVLLDRARFPREKPCAGAIGDRGDAILRSLGAHVEVPGVRIDGIAFRGVLGTTRAAPGGIGRVVRRVEFDDALVRIAVARGAELRDGVRAVSVRDEGGPGVVVETSTGPIRGRAVVGCDGVGSVVRKGLGVGPGRLRAQVVEVDTEPMPTDLERSTILFDATDRALSGYAWDFPTIVGGRALMCRGVYRLKVGAADGGSEGDATVAPDDQDVTALLDARLRAQGFDPAACKHKRYAERGFEAATTVARGALMLVGESAGIDPVTGEGIAQAIEYGALAGRFVAAKLDAAGAGAVALDGWQARLGTSRLAMDLRIRTKFVEAFYGPARADLEAFLHSSPDVLHIGCLHFAARKQEWLTVAEVLAHGGARIVARTVGGVLGGRRGS